MSNPIPHLCGHRGVHFPQTRCGVLTFVGTEDVTIDQGTDIDLTSGVTAYDGYGNEVPYTVEPTDIETCTTGTYEITYRAVGFSNPMMPSFCGLDRKKLQMIDCGRRNESVVRKITVTPVTAVVCESSVCCASVGCSPKPTACYAKACAATLQC